MKSVKTWICETENLDEIPVREMNLIINQVDNNSVGIQAGNMFALSYSTIGQVEYTFKGFNFAVV